MIITLRNDYRIEAEFTKDELSEYGITYEELDYGKIETRRVLWHMLDDIKKKSGADLGFSGKMLIEVMKENGEKYLFCFTRLSHGDDAKSIKQLVKSENPPVCTEFADFEDMLKAISHMSFGKVCSLFEKDGKYRMLTETSTYEKAHFTDTLSEFGVCLSEPLRKKAECLEHWNCLIESDAVKVLSEAFLMNQQQFFCHS